MSRPCIKSCNGQADADADVSDPFCTRARGSEVKLINKNTQHCAKPPFQTFWCLCNNVKMKSFIKPLRQTTYIKQGWDGFKTSWCDDEETPRAYDERCALRGSRNQVSYAKKRTVNDSTSKDITKTLVVSYNVMYLASPVWKVMFDPQGRFT